MNIKKKLKMMNLGAETLDNGFSLSVTCVDEKENTGYY